MLAEIDGAEYKNNPKIAEILGSAGHWAVVAVTVCEPVFRVIDDTAGKKMSGQTALASLREMYERPLSKVYPPVSEIEGRGEQREIIAKSSAKPESKRAAHTAFRGDVGAPLVVLPVFPGTNCEWDMERAFRGAGARVRSVVFRNRGRDDIAASLDELARAVADAQILALSGGFSAGDEPDGSGKYIANVLRSPAVSGAVSTLLEKNKGLILGICNGFQALIKTGLVPYGEFRAADSSMPTLTFNRLGRHVSRMVRTRVMSNSSPWLALEEPDAVHVIPVSHGEGRIVMRHEEARALFRNGQVPFCYVDAQGQPALTEPDNPNGSDFAIEGLSSPDGRILGKMGHSERCGDFIHINIPGNKTQRIFEAGVGYFA
jgi:phosphoribosylformylglycinamidine synthase